MIKIREHYDTLEVKDFKRLVARVKNLPQGKYNVYVLDGRKLRSLQQNAYWHGVVIKTICDHTGYRPFEMRRMINEEFIPIELQKPDGTKRVYPGSTAELNTKQMGELIDQVRLWALENMNIYIPQPNEIPEDVLVEMENDLYMDR